MKKLHWKAHPMGRLGEQVMGFLIRLILLLLSLPAGISLLSAQGTNVACVGNLIITLDENCAFEVLPETVLTGDYSMVDSIAIRIDDTDSSTITGCGNHSYSAELYTNDELTFSCWGNILAEDKTAPLMVCPEDTGEAVLLNDMQVLSGTLSSADSPVFDPSVNSCFQDVDPNFETGDYYYGVHTFNITRTDVFTFIAASSYNGMMALYQGDFNPEEPCQNLIGYSNDTYIGSTEDFDPIVPLLEPSFRLNLSLNINRTYTLVWTSREPLTEGDYGVSVFTDGDGRVTNLSKTQVQLAAELVCLDVEEVALGNTYTFSLHPDGNFILDYDDPFRIPEEIRGILEFTGFPEVSDNCTAMLMTIYDEIEESGDCSAWVITRHFVAQDRYLSDCTDPPLTTECTQTIIVRRPTIDDVVIPSLVTTLECDEGFPTDGEMGGPEDNPDPAYTGFPYLSAALNFYDLNQSACNIGASYSDEPRVVDCPGSYYFRREWTIVDWCAPENNIIVDQIIRVADFTGPTVNFNIPDHNENGEADDAIMLSTSPNNCLAYANLDLPEMSDGNGCSGIGSSMAQINDSEGNFIWGGTLPDIIPLQIGDYTLFFCVLDQCGNETCVEETIQVRDLIAPIAVCDDEITVSLGGGDIQNEEFGAAVLRAEDLDEGSNDHCSDVSIAIRREEDLNWSDEVWFDCADIGDSITIYLQVLDTALNENLCWITVVPEDKIRPVCYAPEDVNLACTELPLAFPGDIAAAYAADFASTSQMMSSIFGGPSGTDNCAVDTLVERTPNLQVNDCGWGSIVRRFEAWQLRPAGDLNNNGQIDISEVDRSSNNCSQTITITEVHDFVIDFPEDAAADCGTPDVPTIITQANGCDILSTNIGDPVVFEATGDECYKYSITYDVINWCVWDGEYEGYVLERMTEDDGEDLPVDRAVEGNERPIVYYNENGLLIDRQHNDRDGDSSIPDASPTLPDYGRYIYTQFVKVYDSSAPEITVEPYGGPTPNCPELVAGAFGDWDGDCLAGVSIPFAVADDCELFDQSGNLVLSIVSAELDAFAVDADGDGEIKSQEFVSDEDISALIINNNDGTFELNGDFPVIPSSFGPDVFHAARVLVADGCGNTSSVYFTFDVIDCKAPAPICINGLAITLMPQEDGGCAMAIWASDYIGSPVYDCTGEGTAINEDGQSEVTSYAIYRALEVEADPDFIPSPTDVGLVLNETDEAITVLYVFAFDAEGNYDFCETYVNVAQHSSCGEETGTIAGFIATEEDSGIPDVEVSVSGDIPQTVMTNNEGVYTIGGISIDSDFSVIPQLNTNPLNGVTTFDLILISKHILGVTPLNSPYKMIAADVNRSNTVSTLDLIQIRKLILNITTEFPNNTSWRFVEAAYEFPAPSNPWAEYFPELINVNNFEGDLAADFVGVKIGDVNGSVDLGAQSADNRQSQAVYDLLADNKRLQAGEVYGIPVRLGATDGLEGFQGTVQLQGADLLAVDYALLNQEHLGQQWIDQGILTMSWNKDRDDKVQANTALFVISIQPKTDLLLSDALTLSSRYTLAEAYVDQEPHPLDFRFVSIAEDNSRFHLAQNIPNPFDASTRIDFTLPEQGEVTLRIEQLNGQLVYNKKLDGQAGSNSLTIEAAQLNNAKGVLTYSLTFGEDTQTRKLVILP